MKLPDLLPWLAAGGMAVERAWKIWSDHKAQSKEARVVSVTEGDSLFRRATEMMDRLEAEAKACREEAVSLRQRTVVMQDELFALRQLLREHGVVIPQSLTVPIPITPPSRP